MSKFIEEKLFSVRAASNLTLAMLFLLPLVYLPGFGSYSALRYFFFGTIVILLGVATAWTWTRAKGLPKSFFNHWTSYGVLAYLAALLLASLFSVDVSASLWSSFQRTNGFFAVLLTTIFALNIFTLLAVRGQSFIYKLFGSSLLGATILSVLIMMFTYDTSGTWFATSLGGATVGNSSLAAAYILWNIFFGVILIFKAEGRRKKIIWGTITALLLLSPLFVNWQFQTNGSLVNIVGAARGAAIGIIIGAITAASIWLIWSANKIKKAIGLAGIGLTILSIITTGIMLLNPSSGLHKSFSAMAGENRFIFWDISIQAFKAHPWLGWGPYTFNIPYHHFFDAHITALPLQELLVDHAHSLSFETLATGGIVLFMALIFFITSIIVALVKAYRLGSLTRLQASLLIGALCGWFLQAQFVFESLVSLTMLFLIAGTAYALSRKPETNLSTSRPTDLQKMLFSALTLGAIILFIYTVGAPFIKSRQMFSIYDTPLPKRTAVWEDFGSGSPMGQGYDSALLFNTLQVVFERNEESLRKKEPAEKRIILNELDATRQYLYEQVQAKKYSYELSLIAAKMSYSRMVIGDNFEGEDLDRGLYFANRAIELSPTNPESYWVAAKIHFASRATATAKQLLEKAYELEPAAPRTNRLILDFAQLTNDTAYYQSALARAKQAIPGFQE